VDNYLACRVFAHWAAREGFSSFYVHQDEIILTADRDGIVLERLWRDSTLDNIKALDLLAQLPEVDAERLGSLGISLGAIRNVVLLAVEPRLRANVLCLGGAGLSKILATSRENLVLRYIRGREAADGITREQVGQDLDAFVRSDPAVFAPYVANDRTLLFLGAIDNKVPYAAGLDLYEGLGRPEALLHPVGALHGDARGPVLREPDVRLPPRSPGRRYRFLRCAAGQRPRRCFPKARLTGALRWRPGRERSPAMPKKCVSIRSAFDYYLCAGRTGVFPLGQQGGKSRDRRANDTHRAELPDRKRPQPNHSGNHGSLSLGGSHCPR
jgi:hypothetical protein